MIPSQQSWALGGDTDLVHTTAMEHFRRVASAAALLIGAACARPARQPSAPPVAAPSVPAVAAPSVPAVVTAVPMSDVDTVVLITGSDVYRWTSAQRDSAMAVLVANRAKWAAYRPRTYEYWEHGWCFCFSMLRSGPRLLVIRNERLVSATDTSRRTTDSAYMKAVRGKPAGIDVLFAQLAAGIRDTAFAEVRVSYDAARGYPVDITYDRAIMVTDDEFYVRVSHLRAIPEQSLRR